MLLYLCVFLSLSLSHSLPLSLSLSESLLPTYYPPQHIMHSGATTRSLWFSLYFTLAFTNNNNNNNKFILSPKIPGSSVDTNENSMSIGAVISSSWYELALSARLLSSGVGFLGNIYILEHHKIDPMISVYQFILQSGNNQPNLVISWIWTQKHKQKKWRK